MDKNADTRKILKRILRKLFFYYVFLFLLEAMLYALSPMIANDMAMAQMSTDTFSNVWIQIYSNLRGGTFFIYLFFGIVLIYKDLKILYKIMKDGEKKDEK